jgi:osmotically-inducible protein OsmY
MVQHISLSQPGSSTLQPILIGHVAGPAELAQAILSASTYAAIRALTCDDHEGVLSIRGQVGSFYLKQVAQTIVRGTPGVEEINNQVHVVRPAIDELPRPHAK